MALHCWQPRRIPSWLPPIQLQSFLNSNRHKPQKSINPSVQAFDLVNCDEKSKKRDVKITENDGAIRFLLTLFNAFLQ
jgi:hypothetical protein